PADPEVTSQGQSIQQGPPSVPRGRSQRTDTPVRSSARGDPVVGFATRPNHPPPRSATWNNGTDSTSLRPSRTVGVERARALRSCQGLRSNGVQACEGDRGAHPQSLEGTTGPGGPPQDSAVAPAAVVVRR